MSELKEIRAISYLSILAAALTVLFALQSSDGRVQLRDPLALCIASKGALCDRLHNEAIPHETFGAVPIADLGDMTVIARRIPDMQVASTIEDVTFLGAMTVTASRLPAPSVSAASSISTRALRLTKARPAKANAESR